MIQVWYSCPFTLQKGAGKWKDEIFIFNTCCTDTTKLLLTITFVELLVIWSTNDIYVSLHIQINTIGHANCSKQLKKTVYIYIYTGCPRRNVPDFGRVFLMLKYTDITQNTYVQSWTITEIMASEVWNLTAVTHLLITKYILKLAGICGFCNVSTCT